MTFSAKLKTLIAEWITSNINAAQVRTGKNTQTQSPGSKNTIKSLLKGPTLTGEYI